MRIGIDAHHLNGKPQGSRTYLIELIRALDRTKSDDDELWIYSFEPAATRELVEGVHRRVFPRSAKLRLPFVVPALELTHRLDGFHSQYIAPPWSMVSEIVTIHDVLFETHPELFRDAFSSRSTRLIRRSAERAGAVLTVSEFSKRAILEAYGIPESRIFVTPNAVDHERFEARTSAPTTLRDRYRLDGPFILSVGRLEPRKNLERLIRAFGRLDHDVQLAIVGVRDFRHQEIVEAAEPLGERVRFLGPVPDDDLPGLYKLSEALAYPSLVEGFGMPVLEAMACGTPVLTSRRGALPEVGGDAVHYVDPLDEESITDGLARLLTETAFRADLRRRGVERAEGFRWEDTARRTLSAYRSAL